MRPASYHRQSSSERGIAWFFPAGLAASALLVVAVAQSQPTFDWQRSLAVAAAVAVSTAMGLRLPRGDVVRVDAMSAGAALALLAPASGMLVMFAGSVLGMTVARRSTRSSLDSIVLDAYRRVAAIGLAYVIQTWVLELVSMSPVASAALAVSAYVLVEFLSLAAVQSWRRRISFIAVSASMARSVSQIYLGQACLGVALAVVYPAMGVWAIPVMTVLGAILLNGFAMYLRVKIAYQETIAALAKVSELHMPGRSGHAQQVANLSVMVGRKMGLGVRDLEALNYAALLHEIGSLGRDGACSVAHEGVEEWALKGAEIMMEVPFLHSAASIVRYQCPAAAQEPSDDDGIAEMCGAIVRACCLSEEVLRSTHASNRTACAAEIKESLRLEASWIPALVVNATLETVNAGAIEVHKAHL